MLCLLAHIQLSSLLSDSACANTQVLVALTSPPPGLSQGAQPLSREAGSPPPDALGSRLLNTHHRMVQQLSPMHQLLPRDNLQGCQGRWELTWGLLTDKASGNEIPPPLPSLQEGMRTHKQVLLATGPLPHTCRA